MHETHTFAITADHPCLPGHFPGRPVVPGVVVLDEVLSGWQALHPSSTVSEITVAKFHRPLGPGEQVCVSYIPAGETVKFECRVGDERVASGRLRARPA